jgi:anti-sigma factor RsiW
MRPPSDNDRAPGAGDERLIDRLVDGELPDAERRELLRRLEAEPGGWRRCALAFLEAQSWREAFAPLVAPTPPAAIQPAAVAQPRRRQPRPWRPVARLVGLAAGLAAAFVLGWAVRGGPAATAPDAGVTRVEAPAAAVPRERPQAAPVEVAAQEARPSLPADPPARSDPALKQWEQRGYRAETQTRLVSLELKDGRKVDVPVREVRLQYVGGRTY